jgi:hypothetical protein
MVKPIHEEFMMLFFYHFLLSTLKTEVWAIILGKEKNSFNVMESISN